MSDRSAIEWTDATWNPVVGCTKVSPGCKRCYAETLAERFRGVPGHPFEMGFDLRLVPSALERPLQWRRGRMVFVNSMSDLFHEKVPVAYIRRVFDVMERCPQHRFQVLTKRADRLAELAPVLPWPANVWMGVSVETARYRGRARRRPDGFSMAVNGTGCRRRRDASPVRVRRCRTPRATNQDHGDYYGRNHWPQGACVIG
jgi:protein gp37